MASLVGSNTAPLLVVMTHEPSEAMLSWFWKVMVMEARILQQDVQLLYLLDEPPENTGARPSATQLKAAKKELAELMAARGGLPAVVVPMGGDAVRMMTGIDGESIFDTRGYVIKKEFFGTLTVPVWKKYGEYATKNKKKGINVGDPKFKWVETALPGGFLGMDYEGIVIPTFTLDYVRKTGFAVKPAFVEDVRRARRALDGNLKVIDNNLTYYTDWNVVTDGNLSWQAPHIKDTMWGDIIAVDIETHGVDNEAIDCVSFSDGTVTATLPWSGELVEYLNTLFATHRGLFAFHNGPFDIPRLQMNGVVIPQEVLDNRTMDTMFAAVVIQPDLHKGLGRVAPVYMDLYPWKFKKLKHGYGQHYSAKDAYVTALLARVMRSTMLHLGQWKLFMGVDGHPGPGMMKTIPTLINMTRTGIKTDRVWAMAECKRLERRMRRYENLWGKSFPGMNPYSNVEVQNLLYGQWKLPIQRNPKQEDGVSVDELALVRLQIHVIHAVRKKSGDPRYRPWMDDPRCTPRLFDLLLCIRDAAKTMSTYVQPVALNEDRWIHPSYLPTPKDRDDKDESKGNTSTGRLASSNPNIQNQPKRVRYMYIPDSDDMVFVQADYKSAELYVMAYSAEDDRLIADLSSDLHQRNADRLGTSRKTAKNVTYAGQYLAGPAKVSEMILKQNHTFIPVEECKRILDGLAEYYWKTAAFKQHIAKMCEVKKHVINAFGRVRFFHDGRAPAAVDFIPQSVVADILWCVLNDCAAVAAKYGGRLTTTVHDSILIQVPSRAAEAAAREMKAAMERPFDCVAKGFYIPVEVEMAPPGKSWGEVTGVAL